MAFIDPMHRNKPNNTYLLTYTHMSISVWLYLSLIGTAMLI